MAIFEFCLDPGYAAYQNGCPPPLYPEGYERPAGLPAPLTVPTTTIRQFGSRDAETFPALAARVWSQAGEGPHTARIGAAQGSRPVAGALTARAALEAAGFDVEVV